MANDQARLAGDYTRADGERIIRDGSHEELRKLKAAINESLSHIESQIRMNPSPPRDWTARAYGAQRHYKQWLERISMRLSEGRPRAAIVIKHAAGGGSDVVADALNVMLARGCHIYAFGTVGGDLVVIASEPKAV